VGQVPPAGSNYTLANGVPGGVPGVSPQYGNGIAPAVGQTQPGLVAAAPAASMPAAGQPQFAPPPQVVTEPVAATGRVETRPLTPATQIGAGGASASQVNADKPVAAAPAPAAPVQSSQPMVAAPAPSSPVQVARAPAKAAPAPAAPSTTAGKPAAPLAKPDAVTQAATAVAARQSAFIWPASGAVVNSFKTRKSKGIGIAGRAGDPIAAAADGEVIFSGLGPRGYGKLLIVKHKSDWLSVYAHNKNLLVKEGQAVRQGQKIAELGSTGTDRPKLHFEIRRQGKPVDPLAHLPQRN
jgi:lipoprotein NlpD